MDAPGDGKKNGITPTRIGIWVVVSAVGLYMIISGLVGVLGGA